MTTPSRPEPVVGAFAPPGADVAMAELFDFSGRVAIVTGGGGGIGEAICRRLSGAGASLVVADWAADRAAGVASALDAAPRRAVSVSGDIRLRATASSAVEAALDQLGGLDILVNCAGLYPSIPVLEMTEDQWDEVLDTNLKGTFLWAQEAGRAMAATGRGGVIVNISSRAGVRALAGRAAYSASKGGVGLLTQNLAMELAGHGIRVNAVAPGPVNPPANPPTIPPANSPGLPSGGGAGPGLEPGSGRVSAAGGGEQRSDQASNQASDQASGRASGQASDHGRVGNRPSDRVTTEWRKAYQARVPAHRFAQGDEIALAVAFLASPAAAFITGVTLLVDGGATLP